MYISPLAQALYSILNTKQQIKQILIQKGLQPTDVFSTYPQLIRKALQSVDIQITQQQAQQIVNANQLALVSQTTAETSVNQILQAQQSYQALSNRLTQLIG